MNKFLKYCVFSFFILSCGDEDKAEIKSEEESSSQQSTTVNSVTSNKDSTEATYQDCSDQEFNSQLDSIENFVGFVNKLPKPTTVPCVISALPRPMLFAATTNPTSAQGATGKKSPRIFLKFGNLMISSVADGFQSDAIELSEVYSEDSRMSIKAELKFPIEEDIQPFTPYERVHVSGDPSCAALCHQGYKEIQTFDNGVIQYASSIIYAKPTWDVLLESAQEWHSQCEGIESQLCHFYKMLLGQGQIEDFKFSKSVSDIQE